VFVNPRGGLVVVGSDLPSIAEDRVFQLWLIPAKGAPQPAGLFHADPAGEFVHVSTEPVDTSAVAAVAVTVEPRGGSKAPTTKPFIVVPLA
jgi:anti-sigma-K factor RskA